MSSSDLFEGFVYLDYVNNLDKGRSKRIHAFTLASCPICCRSILQSIAALLTTEVLYMALTKVVIEAICLQGLLDDLGVELELLKVKCDNMSDIHLAKNHTFHAHTNIC